MCALMLLLLSTAAHASPPAAKAGITYRAEAGDSGLSATSAAGSTTKIYSVDANTGSLFSTLALRFGVDRVDPDYHRYLLVDKAGNVSSLADKAANSEYIGRTGVDAYLKGVKNLAVGAEVTYALSETPFAGGSARMSIVDDEAASGSKISFVLERTDRALPSSFYVDPDTFQTRERPIRSLQNRAAAGWEQILTERAKAKIEAFGAERPASRPPYLGVELSFGWAFGDSQALLTEIGLARELRSSSLFDDRGYFDATWVQAEYRLQPSYRFSWSFVVGTILEAETARGRVPEQRIGSDSLALIGRTTGPNWEAGFRALGVFANTGYTSYQIGGDFTWQL